MSRTDYQRQLEALRTNVVEMSDLACHRLRRALEAYERRDVNLAENVIEGDHELNELYLELEQRCIELIALQQPVAGDLRFIAASFKIITDLERIGDLAVNIAEYADRGQGSRYPDIDISAIGEQTVGMVEDAIEAYATDDTPSTYDVAAADDEVDARCKRASELVVEDLLATEVGDESLLEDVSRTLLTIRDLERVGDHAVNIAARTLYMVDNDDELIY
ncbi:phosphate uptake regulator PhoU [Natronococcus amylolyticus DSM 10524]|uniref:Phosphate-specific transport system accessory protein PhoU n=1 Tax=Natronococcus amylolyticus DSM 10524 TaxID=1227497 RepID=L9WZW6_9EURY|nr:phosphate signaling complex protein PhoU [Natronococcus amylolyticus]ELY53913.1 phosphate uptake regulator PhoU [Natronococcus amylolyticus DSM 10524]